MTPEQARAAMQVMEGSAPFRDVLCGLRAQFENDGFTPDEARRLTVTLVTGYRYDMEGEQP